MGRLFGTNGVRGVFGQTLTNETIIDLTLSLATYFKKGPILIGYDGRETSPVIAKTVCHTLNRAGLDCSNAGLVPTPCLEYVTKKLGYNGGIMITASHNPPEYNGIKPVANDGVEVSREDELVIEDIFFSKNWNVSEEWGTTSGEGRAVDVYIEGINSHIDTKKIRDKKFKVVLDIGNGAQAVTAPLLCKELGCEVIPINENVDGLFPGRGSEPTPENLRELSETVVNSGANMGVAFDGDGDRSLFCDENGKILTGDKSALLLSRHLLEKKPSSTVVTCMNSSSLIEDIAAEFDSRVVRTKVGSVEVSRKLVSTRGLVGYEENGGFMFGPHNHVRDGAMTLALFLELLSYTNRSVSKLIEELPTSFTKKVKVDCSTEQANKVIEGLHLEYPESDTADGIKINFGKQSWIMVRPSGTEPIVRIYGESDSEKKLDSLISEFVAKVNHLKFR